MMNWKKDLTIQTQFYDDPLEGIPDAILISSDQPSKHIDTALTD